MKLLIATAILASSVYAGGIWSMIKNSGLENIKSNAYTIEVEGVDIRAYVFEVKELNSICISVWGGHSASHQLECKTYAEISKGK